MNIFRAILMIFQFLREFRQLPGVEPSFFTLFRALRPLVFHFFSAEIKTVRTLESTVTKAESEYKHVFRAYLVL